MSEQKREEINDDGNLDIIVTKNLKELEAELVKAEASKAALIKTIIQPWTDKITNLKRQINLVKERI